MAVARSPCQNLTIPVFRNLHLLVRCVGKSKNIRSDGTIIDYSLHASNLEYELSLNKSQEMQAERGRRLAAERGAFMTTFCDRLEKEMKGTFERGQEMRGKLFEEFVTDSGRKVILRQPHKRDAEKLLVFMNGLVNEKRRAKDSQLHTGFESTLTLKQERAWLEDLLTEVRNRKIISALAEMDGKIVGNGEIVRGEYEETRRHGRLALTILGTHRGCGIGREMIRALVAEARRQGLKNIHVEFLARNKQAVSAYEKAGFKKVGRIPGKVYRDHRFLDALIMARTL